jgi:hypothetical protein
MTDDNEQSLIPDQDSRPPEIATIADDLKKQSGAKKRGAIPNMLGVSDLRLLEITEQACLRLDDCRNQMGLRLGMAMADWGTWAFDRQSARIMYNGNTEYRRYLGRLFEENNWTLNVPQRIIRMLAAQHAGDLVGADPFCTVMPTQVADPADEKLSKQTELKIQNALAAAKCRAVMAESIRVALTEGERPLKVMWEVDKTQFVGDAVVMVTPKVVNVHANGAPIRPYQEGETLAPGETPVVQDAGGEPVKTASGQYIFPKDEFLRFYVDQTGQPLALVTQTPPDLQTGAPAQSAPQPPPGTAGIQLRLKKEPSFIIQQTPTYALVKNLKQTLIHRQGLNVSGLFCEDFIYPINVTSLTDPDCDIMAHCYDEPVSRIERRYKNAGYQMYFTELRAEAKLSQQSQPILENGEFIYAESRGMTNIHETYYRCAVNDNDEFESWIFLVIDYVKRVPVYAEYLANLKMKRPPFVLLRGVESVPGRAYGAGVYKKFADKNLAIDVWFNRAALKSSKTSSVTFQHEDAWKAEYAGQQLVIGGTEVYKIPANCSEEYGPNHPPVFRVNLNEMSDKEFELMEKLIQDGDLSFGVVNAADGAAADLNASGTATGVRNIERTGNILQRATEELMAGDIEELLELAADTVLENMDEESIQWTPGEDELSILSRDEIRNLPRDVKILLTKAKGEENLATNQQASDIVEKYYAKPLWLRKKIRQFTVQQLKSLFIADADEVIVCPTDSEIAAEAQNPTQAESKEMLQMSLKDVIAASGIPLSPTERQQALAQFGIEASPAQQPAQPGQPQLMPPPGAAPGAAPAAPAPPASAPATAA